MRFPYISLPTARPVVPLGGALLRWYPVFSMALWGPRGGWLYDGHLDTGSDDTIAPFCLVLLMVMNAQST
jgi:hypothetical protein